MTVFVLNLHHRGPSRNAVPAWIRGILLGPIQSILCVGKNDRIPTGRQGSRFLRTMSLRATLENIAQELQNEAQLENGVMADTIVTDGQERHFTMKQDVTSGYYQTITTKDREGESKLKICIQSLTKKLSETYKVFWTSMKRKIGIMKSFRNGAK